MLKFEDKGREGAKPKVLRESLFLLREFISAGEEQHLIVTGKFFFKCVLYRVVPQFPPVIQRIITSI